MKPAVLAVHLGRTGCLAVLLSGLAACNGQLRFDEYASPDMASQTTPDAAPDDPGAATELPSCVDGACSFEREACSPSQCELECSMGSTCSGSCGSSCSTECESQSACTLLAGENGHLKCEGNSRCSATLGPGGTGDCAAGSQCTVRCLGPCLLECADGASCTLACGASEAPRTIMGFASCP